MAKSVNNNSGKVSFGVRKKGKAVKRLNKHKSTKPYNKQG